MGRNSFRRCRNQECRPGPGCQTQDGILACAAGTSASSSVGPSKAREQASFLESLKLETISLGWRALSNPTVTEDLHQAELWRHHLRTPSGKTTFSTANWLALPTPGCLILRYLSATIPSPLLS